LITVTDGVTTIGFRYDGDGNRLAEIVNGTLTTHTLDVGLGLPEVLVAYESAGTVWYLHLLGGVATDDGTAWTYSAADALGSVRQQLDSSGDVESVNSYRPFGSPLEGDGGNPYGFTGEWLESAVGLLYLRARYYNPYLNRFINPDTIVSDFGYPASIHRYLYVFNNPVNFVDPSGYQAEPPPGCEFGESCYDEYIQSVVADLRYLRTEQYGWIDLGHAFPRIDFVADLRRKAPIGGEVKAPGQLFEYYFNAYYWIQKLDENQIDGVAVGIYRDFSRRFEDWQGGFPLGLGSDSSFALEDLPSNYIGLLVALKNPYNRSLPTTADSVRFVLDHLGPAGWTSQPPPHSKTPPFDCPESVTCALKLDRYVEQVKNYDISPRIEIAPGNYANIAWPCDDLFVQPINSGPDSWHFLREEHNRNFSGHVGVALIKIKNKIDRITPW
jgi:RHS repeat-associated protein